MNNDSICVMSYWYGLLRQLVELVKERGGAGNQCFGLTLAHRKTFYKLANQSRVGWWEGGA